MRIINVIVNKDSIIDSIDSFGIFEEQLSDEVVTKAEELFVKKAIELGIDEVNAEECLDDGFARGEVLGDSVCISWSDI